MPRQKIRTILHISLDSFFTSVEVALHPRLRHQPIIVQGLTGPNRVVAGVNYQARALGVEKNMFLDKALYFAPQASVVNASYTEYGNFSREFFNILARFSSSIEPVSLDQAYVDITGFENEWLAPESMAFAIKKAVANELEITCSIGIASNKVCAFAASQYKKPDHISYVPYGKEKQFLDPLPVSILPSIGPRTVAVLQKTNINTIGKLASLPQSLLIHTFGTAGKMLWFLANGSDGREVSTPYQTKSLSRSKTFSVPTLDQDLINSTCDHLLAKISQALKTQNKKGQTLFIRILYQNGELKSRQETFLQPGNKELELYPVLQRIFNKVKRSDLKIKTINLGITNFSYHNINIKQFNNSFNKIEKIKKSINKINRQFGFVPSY